MKVPVPEKPSRKLGQNFLTDQNVLEKVLRFIQPTPTDVVVEIGAGTGALTSLLAGQVAQLVAIEKDSTLLGFLQAIPGVRVVHEDIRKVDLCALVPDHRVRVIGNLPYYISTAILTTLIAQRNCIADMILMFQEEVAQRIIAPPSSHDYSMLSVLSQYFCDIHKGFRISRNSFTPKPEIESRILQFNFRPGRKLNDADLSSFLVKSFSQRRKKLRNNLLRTLNISPEKLDGVFQHLQIPESARAENLSAEQFESLMLAL